MNALLLLLAACRGPSLPEPALEAVRPDLLWRGEPQQITLTGENFFPRITIDARTGGASVNPTWRVFLVGPDGAPTRVELEGVTVEETSRLSATVPPLLAVGAYEVRVEGPAGLAASLPSAVEITDRRADKLVLSSDVRIYDVGQEAAVTITLVGTDKEKYPLDLEITVSAAEGDEAEFRNGTLDEGGQTPDGGGVQGFLRDGEATVYVSTTTPDEVLTVVADPYGSDVEGARLELSFVADQQLSVKLELPESPLPDRTWEAGDVIPVVARLVDQYGSPVEPDQPPFVLLQTTCSDWTGGVELTASTTVIEVVPENVCPNDRLEVVYPTAFATRSRPYSVVAGPPDHFAVTASPPRVRAGDLVDVPVDPMDAFDNRTTFQGSVVLEDSEGGLVGSSCTVFGASVRCTGTVTVAGPAVTFTATGDGGVTGVSDPIEVLADDVPGSLVLDASGPASAGTPLEVRVHVLDAWGNEMDGAEIAAGAVAITDERGDVACLPGGVLPGGALAFDCTFEAARPGAELTATLAAASLEARATLDVQNGPLAEVAFTVPTSVVAGGSVIAQVAGTDAFGNPYVVQSDPVVQLTDESGTFSVRQVTLNASGTAPLLGTITRAGATRLVASQGGVELGRSAPILVEPAATDGLRVTPTEPWGWVGAPMDVQVESVDVYGNRTDETLAASLASLDTASPSVPVNLVNGVGVAAFTWSEAAWPDHLEATSGVGSGQTLLLVPRVCAPSPAARLDFGGFPEAVACVDGDGTAPIVADLSGSTRGAAPLVAYGVSVNGAPSTIAGPPGAVSTRLPAVGRHQVRGIVVDNQGCGSETAADGWAGPDDGTAVGPIALSSTAAQLNVSGSVPLTITGVVDCARDPASFALVEVLATAGTVSPVVASGAGPEIELDNNGDFAGTWDTSLGLSAATASVVAWTDNGAASGVLELPVVGDSLRPVVLDCDPQGYGTGPVSELRLTFSEPMWAGTANASLYTVGGPAAITVDSATLTADDEVTLAVSPPIDRDLGAFTITVSSLVRDRAGNKLAGTWAGQAPWTGGVGGSGAPPAAATCAGFDPPSRTFRPDGDDGPGEEADVFTVEVSAPVAPAWWVTQVRDGAGELVFERWTVPLGADDTVEWTGRDLRGVLVEDGTYTVSVEPDDGLGNRGSGCVSTVLVDALPRGVP